tara:strand:- start:2066 stop:2917 length:852 start_codon:yes stop_codon:yes gene_type:complete
MSTLVASEGDPALITDPFFQIHITHLPTNNTISFKGWVTEFSDAFTSTWNSETVYGRMDPLVTFQNTGRAISLGFDVPSSDGTEAASNLARLNRLAQFLYPIYASGPERTMQNTIQGGPLIGLKWTNMIGNAQNGERLIGYLGGFTYQPDLNAGSFFSTGTSTEVVDTTTPTDKEEGFKTRDVSTSADRAYVPKVVSVSLNFTVLHTHLTGWYKNGGSGGYTFGNDDVDAKFPSAHFVLNTETQAQQSDIGGGDDDSYENVGEIQKSKETEVLNALGSFKGIK